MNNEVRNDKNSEKLKAERKFIQISPESIELIADSAGYSNISTNLSKSLAEDASYRLRELIQSCGQILRHSKHMKLTKEDINLALHWSDVPQLHGQDSQLVDFTYIPELEIYCPADRNVDLTQEYSVNVDVEVYSPMKLSIQYHILDPENETKNEIYLQYFEKISQSLLSTSDCVVEVALANLQENSRLQPLLPTLSAFLKNLVGFSHENCHIVKRIPSIFNALIRNPHLNIEPEKNSFLQLLLDLLLQYGGTATDDDVFHLASRVSHLIAKVSQDSSIDEVVQNLSDVIADNDRSILVQSRSLMALRCLSSKTLDAVLFGHWNALLEKLQLLMENGEKALHVKDALISAAVAVLRYRIIMLDREPDLTSTEVTRLWTEGREVYRLTSELLGPSVLRIGEFPSSLCRQVRQDRTKPTSDSCKELYWVVKSLHRPTPQGKWQYSLNGNPRTTSKPTDLLEVFDYSEKNARRIASINFRVRNWKQRPMQLLKRKAPAAGVVPAASGFAHLSNTKFKPFSKCYLANSELRFHLSFESVL